MSIADAPQAGQAAWYELLRMALVGLEALSDGDAAQQLAAQTHRVIRDVPTADARALLFVTGEWSAVAMAAASARAGSRTDAAAALAITIEDSFRTTETLQTSAPLVWNSIQQGIAVMVQGGLVSEATAATLLALREHDVPVWKPAPTEQDVAYARRTGA